jgi:hypothetical protein
MATESAVFPQARRETESARRSRALTLHTPLAGMLWFGGWLFTLGIAQLGFWKAVLALLIWPYFLGVLAR